MRQDLGQIDAKSREADEKEHKHDKSVRNRIILGLNIDRLPGQSLSLTLQIHNRQETALYGNTW